MILTKKQRRRKIKGKSFQKIQETKKSFWKISKKGNQPQNFLRNPKHF